MFIEAKDLDQAVELAKGSPMMEGEGSLEIRPIVAIRDASPRMGFMKDTPGVVDHLFRQEAGKMIAYLSRIFGLERRRRVASPS
jgi:hypothetical protein